MRRTISEVASLGTMDMLLSDKKHCSKVGNLGHRLLLQSLDDDDSRILRRQSEVQTWVLESAIHFNTETETLRKTCSKALVYLPLVRMMDIACVIELHHSGKSCSTFVFTML